MRRIVTCLCVFALTTMVSLIVNAAERPTSPEAKGAWMTATPSEIDAAIYHILAEEPAHHLRKDAVARMELSEKIVKVCNDKGVPPLFALSIIFRESDFDEKAVGLLGELGLMQVAKGNVKRLKCDMSSPEGQIECGTGMLQDAYEVCHSWGGALMRYATTTGICRSDDASIQAKIKIRLRDWQKLSIAVQSALYEQGSEE